MADLAVTNPYVVTVASATAYVWKDVTKHPVLIQWVDDNGDIANGSNLIMTINGVAVEATIQIGAGTGLLKGAVVWELSFPMGNVPIHSLLVGTMSAGQVYIFFR